jgi:hypothetical protein
MIPIYFVVSKRLLNNEKMWVGERAVWRPGYPLDLYLWRVQTPAILTEVFVIFFSAPEKYWKRHVDQANEHILPNLFRFIRLSERGREIENMAEE